MRELVNNLKPYADIAGRSFSELKDIADSLEKDAAAASNLGRKLRIAVVGQVKAGKSSFLNAILFQGDGVLPKAATPMTAALTLIRYAPKLKAEIEFYDQDDWKKISEADAAYRALYAELEASLQAQSQRRSGLAKPPAPAMIKAAIPEEYKAAHELVSLVQKNGLDVSHCLGGKPHIIEDVEAPQELMLRLADYVGAEGHYTPIVRSSVIYYNNPSLQAIEIIDTPGINDPVLSRGRRTKEYLGQCDVVFFLSPCGQFLDAADVELLAQNLPAKGVKDIVLIGSQFDGILPGECENYDCCEDLVYAQKENLSEQFRKTVAGLLKEAQTEGERNILANLAAIPQPVFISAMAYNIARHFHQPNKEEMHFLNNYNSMYEDLDFDPELLLSLSGIPEVAAILDSQRAKKEEILRGRLDELLRGAQAGADKCLVDIRREADRKAAALRDGDMKTLTEKEKAITARLTKGRGGIEGAFDNTISKIRRDFALLKTEIKRIVAEYSTLREQTGSYTKEYTVSTSKWWNPFSWGSTETRTRTITYRFANVHDAIDQVEQFALDTEARLKKCIVNLIDLPRLKADIRGGAMSLFDLGDSSFDVEDITQPVDRAVNRIQIPEIDFGNRDYAKMISSQFSSGQVKDSAIDSLRQAQRSAIYEILSDMEIAVGEKTREIVDSLTNSQMDFVEHLLNDIQQDLATLREQLQHRQETLGRLEELKNLLTDSKN